jgi:hypothetical protein
MEIESQIRNFTDLFKKYVDPNNEFMPLKNNNLGGRVYKIIDTFEKVDKFRMYRQMWLNLKKKYSKESIFII